LSIIYAYPAEVSMSSRNRFETNDRHTRQVLDTEAPVSAYLDYERTTPLTPDHFRNPRANVFLSWQKGLFDRKNRPMIFANGYLVFTPAPFHRIPLFNNPQLAPQDARNLKIFDYQDAVEGTRAFFSTCLINDNPGNWRFELWGFFEPVQVDGSTPLPTKMLVSNSYDLEVDLGRCADW
jgi:hypothetical protein